MGLVGGRLEGQDKKGQKLERHVEHGGDREEDLVGRTGAVAARAGATAAAAESDMVPRVAAVEAGIPIPALMAGPSAGRPG